MKCLVSGATGFIGRNLVKNLVPICGRENLTCLADSNYEPELELPGRAALKELGVSVIDCDITSDRPSLPAVAFDLVFHLASNTSTAVSDQSVNEIGTRNLFSGLSLSPGARVVFTSSIAATDNAVGAEAGIDERSILGRPLHPYGRAKLDTEKFLIDICARQNISLTIVRVCGIFGTGSRSGGLFAIFRRLAADGSLIGRLNFPGRIGLLAVGDLARILVDLSQCAPAPGTHEIYSPASGNLTFDTMLQLYAQGSGATRRKISLPSLCWTALRAASRAALKLEPIMPFSLFNRIWQFHLLVSDAFNIRSTKIQRTLPNLQLEKFEEYVSRGSGR